MGLCIEHVSRTQGDGLGYDIVLFETDGRERMIEVKTTAFDAMTPFFASKREVSVSEDLAPQFQLYRIFKFRDSPNLNQRTCVSCKFLHILDEGVVGGAG
ncbi:MAG: DUF3883 domain-containing protein [Gemmatimonadaceae bacterium]